MGMFTDISPGLLALYAAVAALALLVMGLNPRWLPAMLVLAMPAGNFDLEGPVSFSLSKIILLVFVITLPAQIASASRQMQRIRFPLALSIFLMVVVVTTLGSLVWSAGMSSEGFEALRGPVLRPIVQMASLGLRISAFVAIQMWASDDDGWARICKATLFASTLVAAYGVYQFIGYYSELPVMTIHRPQSDLSGGYAFFNIGSLSIFRVGSFVGEPKVAASFLLPSIILIIFARSTGNVRLRSWLTSIPVLVLHLVVFILTFATSSLFALIISFPFLAYLLWRLSGRLRLDRLVIAAIVLYVAVGVLIALGGGSQTATEILRARTTERVQSTDTPEPPALNFLMDNPRVLLTGVGWGNTSFYLRPYYDPYYYLPLTVTVNSGYLQILLEGGLPALLAFLFFLGGALFRFSHFAWNTQDAERRDMLTITLAVCVVVAATHAFTSTETQIWVFWGLLMSLWRVETQSDHAPVCNSPGLFNPVLGRRINQHAVNSLTGN